MSSTQLYRNHLKIDDYHRPKVDFYSFKETYDTSVEDLKKFGIKSPVEVGEWLVQILRTRFKQDELADNLKAFIQNNQ